MAHFAPRDLDPTLVATATFTRQSGKVGRDFLPCPPLNCIGQEAIPDRTSLFLFCACEIDCRKQANRGRITFILIISFKIKLIKSENLFQSSAYIFRFRLHFAVQ